MQENTAYISNNIVLPADKVSCESLFHQVEANSKWKYAQYDKENDRMFVDLYQSSTH